MRERDWWHSVPVHENPPLGVYRPSVVDTSAKNPASGASDNFIASTFEPLAHAVEEPAVGIQRGRAHALLEAHGELRHTLTRRTLGISQHKRRATPHGQRDVLV